MRSFMSRQKPNKKEKFAASQAQAAQSKSTLALSQVPAWWPLLPVVLAVLAYANTLNHGFALDDYAAILENTSTRKGWAALGEIFKTSYRYGYILLTDDLYRPLTKAVFAFFWELWPDNPFPGHALNITLYAFTCFSIYKVLVKWFPSKPQIALLTSCLFAVHPIHTEVVANIKSLDEILAFLFCLMSLDLYIDFSGTGKKRLLISASLCYFLAFLSKESAVTFIVLYPLMDWFVNGKHAKDNIKGFLVMLVPLLLFFLIRHQVLYNDGLFRSATPSVADNMLSSARDPITRFSGAVAMMGLYLWKLLVPLSLSFDLSYPQVTPAKISDFSFLLSAAVLLLLLFVAVKGLKNREILSAGIFIFFINAAVSSNIFMLIGTHYGERLMYAPSLGYCLALSCLLVAIPGNIPDKARMSPTVQAITVLLLLVFAGLSIQRNPVWKNNNTLYASGLISAPNSARVHYYQGLILVKPETLSAYPASSRDSAENAGIEHLKRSVVLYPAFADAWTQLGVAFYRRKNYQESLRYYNEALKYNRYDPVVYNNSGSVYFEIRNYEEALKRYMEAIRLKPDYADAYMNIGSCYGVAGNYDEAIRYLEKAVYYDPELSQAYYFLGITWQNKGNAGMANQYFQMSEKVKAGK